VGTGETIIQKATAAAMQIDSHITPAQSITLIRRWRHASHGETTPTDTLGNGDGLPDGILNRSQRENSRESSKNSRLQFPTQLRWKSRKAAKRTFLVTYTLM